MEYFHCVIVLRTLFYITLFSQAGVLAVVMVESLLPFLDVVFNHLFHFVLEPYFSLIWRKLFNWICVYITLTTLVLMVIKKKVDTHGETRPRQEVFKPTNFYQLFESRLGRNEVDELCHMIISQNGLTQDEIECLMSHRRKQVKLMKLLEMLNRKVNCKEILLNACRSLAENPHSHFSDFEDMIRQNTIAETSEEPSNDSTSEETNFGLETLHDDSHTNMKFEEEQFEIFNSFFRLSEGVVSVSVVAAKQVQLPFESELVSALWLVTVSSGAKVTVGLSHCVKLSMKSMSRIAMVMTTELQKPLTLLYNEEASFSCSNQHGTVNLPVLHEAMTYLVGIAIRPDPEPQPTGILSYFRSNALTLQYQYLVIYQLCLQSKSFNYNHWRVHILSFKYICGNFTASELAREHLHSNGYVYVRNGPLSVSSVKQKGGKWKIVQKTNVCDEKSYRRFTFDIDWTGAGNMPDDFHCTIKWKGTKEVSKTSIRPNELHGSLVAALGLTCPEETAAAPTAVPLLHKMTQVTEQFINRRMPLF